MIIMDGKTPKGRELKPLREKTDLSPCKTRPMTDEEWERYGRLNLEGAKKRKSIIASLDTGRHSKKAESLVHNKSFGEKLKAERVKRGIGSHKMAYLCGLCHATILKAERGEPLKKLTVEKICNFLGWDKKEVCG